MGHILRHQDFRTALYLIVCRKKIRTGWPISAFYARCSGWYDENEVYHEINVIYKIVLWVNLMDEAFPVIHGTL